MIRKMLMFIIFISSTMLAKYPAGVLPYAWHDNQFWFLFGQEAKWIRQLQWQDFGGSPDKPQERAYITAAREFSEETRGIWGNSTDLYTKAGFNVPQLNAQVNEFHHDRIENYVPQNKKALAQNLREQSIKKSEEYILPKLQKIVRELPHFRIYNPKYNYTLFIAEVDYIPIEQIRNAPKFQGYDKVDYAWVPLLRTNPYEGLVAMLAESENEARLRGGEAKDYVNINKKFTDPTRDTGIFKVFPPLADTLLNEMAKYINIPKYEYFSSKLVTEQDFTNMYFPGQRTEKVREYWQAVHAGRKEEADKIWSEIHKEKSDKKQINMLSLLNQLNVSLSALEQQLEPN